MASSNVDQAMATLRGPSSRDANLATRWRSPDKSTQHKSSVADGIAGFREQIGRSRSNGNLEVVRVIEDGAFVLVHGRDESAGGKVSLLFFASKTISSPSNGRFRSLSLHRTRAGTLRRTGLHSQTVGRSRKRARLL
jgi:hypothetical protein